MRDALMADTAISERQKQVLLEIYESFCKENRAEVESNTDTTESAQTPDSGEKP
jgi:hypothetical protein